MLIEADVRTLLGEDAPQRISETDLEVLSKILDIPEFSSLTSNQKREALNFGLCLTDALQMAALWSLDSAEVVGLKRVVNLTLGVAKNLGDELADKIKEVSLGFTTEAIKKRRT